MIMTCVDNTPIKTIDDIQENLTEAALLLELAVGGDLDPFNRLSQEFKDALLCRLYGLVSSANKLGKTLSASA